MASTRFMLPFAKLDPRVLIHMADFFVCAKARIVRPEVSTRAKLFTFSKVITYMDTTRENANNKIEGSSIGRHGEGGKAPSARGLRVELYFNLLRPNCADEGEKMRMVDRNGLSVGRNLSQRRLIERQNVGEV